MKDSNKQLFGLIWLFVCVMIMFLCSCDNNDQSTISKDIETKQAIEKLNKRFYEMDKRIVWLEMQIDHLKQQLSNQKQTTESNIQPDYYIVQPGDTLYRIAMQFDITVGEIKQYNRLSDQDQIYVGQKLKIKSH
jgi:LysM repeat protein